MPPSGHDSGKIVHLSHDDAPKVVTLPVPMKQYEVKQVIDGVGPEVIEQRVPSNEREHPPEPGNGFRSRRKLYLMLISITLLVLLAIGLGVGLSLGSRSQSQHSGEEEHANAARPIHKAPVTSGTTGIAAYSCNTTGPYSTYTTRDGTKFREECHIVYREGTWAYGSANDEIEDLSRLTVYSFESCMDHCGAFNANIARSNSSDTKCGAVAYNANLTFAVDRWHGNCFLKNARGTPYASTPDENYAVVGSAYVVG